MKKVFTLVVAGMLVVQTSVMASSSSKILNSLNSELASVMMDGDLSMKDVAKVGVHLATETGAVPATVNGASLLGLEASTGTAISSLNGAAAVSATSYAIGSPVAGVLSAVGITVAPAVVGGVIIAGTAVLVASGINELFFSED